MKGKVYLVGAGPGDYKLITLKGLEAIRKADVIVYDRLANDRLLKEAKKGCEFIYVGKASSNHTMPQKDINRLLVNKAKEGKIVTRLKGGDPYVFGRGGEEGEFLYKEEIDFEVIPGITSAIGGLCYAGIPVTHRDYASSFHVITGHLKDDDEEIDWKTVANLRGTLIFLMGLSRLKSIVQTLIKHGKQGSTPAAVINRATWKSQRVVTGTLEDIYDKVHREGIESPAIIVVGDVVNLRDKLNYFEKKLLFGKNIVVTRSRVQSSTLVEKIEEFGGNAIEIPTIEIRKIEPNDMLEDAINHIKEYSYIIFTSANGVNIFFEKLFDMGYDSRILHNSRIVAVGKGTAKELNRYGIKADIVPKKFVGEGIFEELKDIINKRDRILIPRSKGARSFLVDELSKICSVTEVKTYETLKDESEKDRLLDLINDGNIDYITFTSSSTVENFISMAGAQNIGTLRNIKIISIGPITSEAIRKHSLNVYREAREHTIDGIVQCIIEDVQEG